MAPERMIDPNGDHDSFGALFLGAFVCLLAYCLLAMMVGLLHMVPIVVTDTPFKFPDLLTSPLLALAVSLVGTPVVAIGLGIPGSWWYTFPVACIAGFVLSFRYHRR